MKITQFLHNFTASCTVSHAVSKYRQKVLVYGILLTSTINYVSEFRHKIKLLPCNCECHNYYIVEYNMTLADVCSDASVYSVLCCVVHNKHIIYTER